MSDHRNNGSQLPGLFLHGGDPTPCAFPNPKEVQHHQDKEGRRFTKVTFPAPFRVPIVESPDQIFDSARRTPAVLNERFFWFFIMPWLNNSKEQIDIFWTEFDQTEKTNARKVAILGTKAKGWQAEQAVIEAVTFYERLRSIQNSDEASRLSKVECGLLTITLQEGLIDWLVHATTNDPAALTRLHELSKSRTSAKGTKGDSYSVNGQLLSAFETLVAKEQRLPTKASVRIAACFNGDQNQRRQATRAFGELGLSGLPEEG